MKFFLIGLLLIQPAFAGRLKLKVKEEVISKVCERMEYKDCSLVKAIAKHESGFDALSIGHDGAGSLGLMQIKCSTARSLDKLQGRKKIACDKLFNPYVNVQYGIEYLTYLQRLLSPEPTVRQLLSAYNGGYHFRKKDNTYRVKYCNAISFKKKRNCKKGELFNKDYVNMVFAIYQKYRGK